MHTAVAHGAQQLLLHRMQQGMHSSAKRSLHRPHPYPCQVLHGELTEAPLETLSAVAQGVFLPLLSCPQNQEGWPDVVAREVTENMHKFVANGELCRHGRG